MFLLITLWLWLSVKTVTGILKKVKNKASYSLGISRRNESNKGEIRKYRKKIRVFKNGVIDIKLYEDSVFINYDTGGRKLEDYISDDFVGHRADTVVRAWERIVNFGNSNFTNKDKFITLTFAKEEYRNSLAKANYEFKKFVERLKSKYGSFKYLTIIELHRAGGVHYHMLSDLPYIENRAPNRKLEAIWGNGTVTINRIKDVDDVGVYLTGYAHCKKKEKYPKLQSGKTYLRSNNLEMTPWLIGEDYRRKIKGLIREGKIEVDENGLVKNVRKHSHYERPLFKKPESVDERETSNVEHIKINPASTYKKAKKISVDGLLERL